eukprot:5559409-Amphidinium_carterae.2
MTSLADMSDSHLRSHLESHLSGLKPNPNKGKFKRCLNGLTCLSASGLSFADSQVQQLTRPGVQWTMS